MTTTIALIGVGAVGSSFVEAIDARPTPADLELVLVADSDTVVIDADGLDPDELLYQKRTTGLVGESGDLLEALEETSYDVLVESSPTTLGDAEPAFSYLMTAIDNGAHVVTANKGPVALRYRELADRANMADIELRMNATVGGGVPVVPVLEEVLIANEVLELRGILNGTCNFILSRMQTEGLAYDHVLGEAQDMGIAEEDPSFDVQGIDTALKCAILANVVYDAETTLDDVEMTGITDITPEALNLARESGQVVKLVGEVSRDRLTVAPRLVPEGDPLDVGGILNVVTIEGDLSGELSLAGFGAGGPETASALVSDVLSAGKSSR